MSNKEKFHFIGINGSGMVGVACLAKEKGYDIDGCDLSITSDYSKQLSDLGINVSCGQSEEHIKNIDKLVVSPAVFFRDKYKKIGEITKAMELGIDVIRWQQFVDEYLAIDRELIGVCGTHGKTTTSTIIANLLESCGADPSAIIGGINRRWQRNYRNGSGKYFVCESDEYGHNFTYYHPKYIVINNLEMEHPEFFKNIEEYKQNFCKFIGNIKKNGAIIFNADDNNILDIIGGTDDIIKSRNIKLLSYSLKNKDIANDNYFVEIKNNYFVIDNEKFPFINNLDGEHNIRNMAIAITLLKEFGFKNDQIKKSLNNCIGAKRRMEKVFENEDFIVYDDYAHHHTQVYNNLITLRNKINSNEKIIAVLEPHLISRFTNNSNDYIKAMEIADFPIITKFFKSREADLDEPDMDRYLQNTKIRYISDFNDVINYVSNVINMNNTSKIHVVVMGAGLSYKLTRNVVQYLSNIAIKFDKIYEKVS